MDSKSISLTGVGVQVPASAPISRDASEPADAREARGAPAPASGDELVPALVAVVLHKLANTTQYLGALNTLLSFDGVGAASAPALAGLGPTAVEVDEMGWTLALLSDACGANLLLNRREQDGLRPFLKLVVDASRRAGRSVELDSLTVPRLVPGGASGAWRAPWAIGRWIYGAALLASRGDGRIDVRFDFASAGGAERARVTLRGVESAALARLEASLTDLDPRVAFEDVDGGRALVYAAGVLAPRAARGEEDG